MNKPAKPFRGWDVIVELFDADGSREVTVHYSNCSEKDAERKARRRDYKLKGMAQRVTIGKIVPLTYEQYVAAYGVPGSRQ